MPDATRIKQTPIGFRPQLRSLSEINRESLCSGPVENRESAETILRHIRPTGAKLMLVEVVDGLAPRKAQQ